VSTWYVGFCGVTLALCVAVTCAAAPHPEPEANPSGAGIHNEAPDDPPGALAAARNGASAAASVSFGRFTHIQVNVNGAGGNIIGDAANEPTIAVDPHDATRIAIGWRQFDTIASNFRQAGYGYSTDGGTSWATGVIEPGVFRTDPVLDFDAQGRFFYNSLKWVSPLSTQVFPSTDGGATWGAGAPAYGGDKQWMTIDRTGGSGHGHVYEAWSFVSNPTPGLTFSRSIDGGATFQSPTAIPGQLVWGTLAVGPDGTLYVVGTLQIRGPIYVARSTDAQDPGATPSFTSVPVSLGGGSINTGGPNPSGLLGQLWIAVDRSAGPRSGWVYVLASVVNGSDPLDVMFARSTDGGVTWSPPRRVNDDAMGNGAYQWFGTMSVSPEGRIDAVWNDTRGSADINQSALYYSYSDDGGATWSVNEQASPTWNSTVGWPNQNKIGDYYHMISRSNGADLAWAATFNGEQDVYFVRIPLGTTAVATSRAPELDLRVLPNPFRGTTSIAYAYAGPGRVRLDILDPAGRRITTLKDGWVAGGAGTARWNGTDGAGRTVAPGIYLARLVTDQLSRSVKVLLLK